MSQDDFVKHLLSQHDGINSQDAALGLAYLTHYGHLANSDLAQVTLADVAAAVRSFQNMAGIAEDGVLGPVTARVMMAPRCGVPDIQPLKQQMGDQFHEAIVARWNKKSLLYYWDQYLPGLPKDVQEDIEHRCWQNWTNIVDLKVDQTRDQSKADIIISIGNGRRDQFDGPGGTLAWAYLPPGDNSQLLKRYDAAEHFVDQLTSAVSEIGMEEVGTHENGHLLGLDHSNSQVALMAPFYKPGLKKPQQNDDVPRILMLYAAAAPAPIPPPKPTPGPTPSPGEINIRIKGSQIDIPGYRVIKLG